MKGKYITTQILLACKAKPVRRATGVIRKVEKVTPEQLKLIAEAKSIISSFQLVAA